MSEPERAYLFGANRYHDLPERTQEQVDAAYYEVFWLSHAGQVIMDDLYIKICCSHMTRRVFGQVDLRNYMLERMRAHQARLARSDDDGRTPDDTGPRYPFAG